MHTVLADVRPVSPFLLMSLPKMQPSPPIYMHDGAENVQESYLLPPTVAFLVNGYPSHSAGIARPDGTPLVGGVVYAFLSALTLQNIHVG